MERIVVVGAGTMGRGIAQVSALAGLSTTLCDVSPSVLEHARTAIEASVRKGIEKGKNAPDALETLENIRWETNLESAVREADGVIEAAPESESLKAEIFSTVAKQVSATCLLASNTSSLSITGLAAHVPQPGRFLGLHFFNPVPIMALVEVVRGLDTDDGTIERGVTLARKLGKEPIVVKDSPGFATSRLGVVLGLEAIRMLESGVATAPEIDRALELGYRHPMGPLRLTDLVGLDVRLAIADHLHHELGEQFRPPALLRTMVRAGRLGKKTGRGFYTWD